MILALILCIYTLAFVGISYTQIRFLKQEKDKQAIILDEKTYKEAAQIGIENEKFKIFSHIYTLILYLFWLFFGFFWLKNVLISQNSVLENTLFLLAFLFINTLASLPLSVYEDFVKNKKQGFSNMNATLFIKDTLKNFILLAVFGFLLLYALVFCYEFLGQFWWVWAFALSFVVILFINLLYPTLIAPLFNKMTPLEDSSLLAKIDTLMQKCGFSAKGVFVMDASKRDKRLNAYFGGLFKSKRVVLFDTLLKALNENQLLAVLGHELGHFVHKDLVKGLFSSALMFFVLFFVFAHLPEFFYIQSDLQGVNAGVFALFIIFSEVFSLIFSPLVNLLSRKNEFNADKHGALMTSKEDMKNALFALAKENKAFVKTSKIYEFFHLSHPSIDKRIKALS
ncbi:M48 family metallopeptidase [Campylobacter sp. MIT 97-5078]|uniref:M48 family metallopeptidase n=1 Tax=Campylobacter sp. MIT 97-5078 TaxID=1548153 RepID=UPI0005130E5C|nr:M48 family metallopeptidase [Campylobacter sp. MIT 97-5078]KGI57311.1 peptidase M48 [Campylobacter sp. MIT 97-5078]TQR28225.1 M48 family peptidase [Campylobacter sp. MIT 97-5078]